MYMQNDMLHIEYIELKCYDMCGFTGVQIVSSVMNVVLRSSSEHHSRSIK